MTTTLRLVVRRAFMGLYVATGVLFLFSVAQFYDPETGFTRLIEFGSVFENTAPPALQRVPHHVNEDSTGYDGQFYALASIDPLLLDPATRETVGSYRARRTLFSMTAYLLGFGDPSRAIQVYAVQNILTWLIFAVVLCRWLPPDGPQNFLRWLGCVFSYGMISSARFALLDGPSVLLITLVVLAIETGRPYVAAVTAGLAGLARETNVLIAGIVLPRQLREITRGALGGLVLRAGVLVAPLAVWIAYVYAIDLVGLAGGSGNFATPLSGYYEKWVATLEELRDAGWGSFARFNVYALVSLTTQAVFLLVRPRPEDTWWRVGVPFVVLMAFLGGSVWAEYPGATTRVVLPMSIAFNVLLPPAVDMAVAGPRQSLRAARFRGDSRAVALQPRLTGTGKPT